ncbi:hypothetical protein [uncultured Algibacter sp.]|uniref:DUF7010 family protein n=1 Tax=uncultured Algibacter sp. TaxID=298659 RepID=UPI002628F4C7|nr:hypothetical protein [uncultured Algibacter sp.]
MKFKELQKDMCVAYVGGGTGVLVSSIIWFVSGIVGTYSTEEISVLTFFIGGMLIYPLGIFSAKLFHRIGKHQKNNPLAFLAFESTAILFIGLFMAYSIFHIEKKWFFPVMLMIIGARYLIFQSIYGMKIYWILGLLLTVSGMFCLISYQAFHVGAIIGGIVEIIFGVLIIQLERKSN